MRVLSRPHGANRIGGPATLLVAVVALSGCASFQADNTSMHGAGMMSEGGHGYSTSRSTCTTTPSSLPGATVVVGLGDMGATRMMSGVAPMGARMRLIASAATVASGQVSFVADNRGWRTHELIILPLKGGAAAGRRPVGSDGKVSEAGALGEASADCGPGAGGGIPAGSASWVTLALPAGRYELICNIINHYADGMHQELTVI